MTTGDTAKVSGGANIRHAVFMAAAALVAGLSIALWFSSQGSSQGAKTGGDAGAVADSGSLSEAQKRDVEAVVRSYLLKNPKLLLEVRRELEKLVAMEEAETMKKAIAKNADYLFRNTNAPMAGNPDGDIPVVEFFDYNCGYCKRSFKNISDLVAKDPKVKVVFMEYPILSKGSLEASKVALAARNQGKYWEVHSALLQHKGGIDNAVAMTIAEAQGLDMDRLKKDVASPEIAAELEKVQALAQSMDIQGTPHFLVGDRNIPGAPRDLLNQILKNAAELRKEGCSVC